MECVEKVLPLWENALPGDRTPHNALAQVRAVLDGEVPTHDLIDQYAVLWSHCDELALEREELQIVLLVGYGAAQVLSVAAEDDVFDAGPVDTAITDADVNPDEPDAAFCAAAAYADGTVWVQGSDREKRREFWEWWLNEAVPRAWRLEE